MSLQQLIHYYKIEHPENVDNSIAAYIKKNDTVNSYVPITQFQPYQLIANLASSTLHPLHSSPIIIKQIPHSHFL